VFEVVHVTMNPLLQLRTHDELRVRFKEIKIRE
jgi:hypothetical protein